MKPWLIFLIAIAAVAVLFGLTAALSSCSTPVQITDVKTLDEGSCICLSWSTNVEAICKVTYCEGVMCYTSPLEPEYGLAHCYGIPPGFDKVTITAIGRDGQATSISLP